MGEDALVSSADIARLGGVGRAAVSNWRRRYEDFPAPAGGTASSPLFSLQAIQSWLTTNGKAARVPLAEQVWQRLRATTEDLELGGTVARAGAYLLQTRLGQAPRLPGSVRPELADRALRTLLTELAEEQGPATAFERLCERYREAHARTLATTSTETARIMVRLLGADPGTVLDPACGIGTLLLDAGPRAALAQDTDPNAAAITAARLRLAGIETTVIAADSLRHNGFTDEPADAVVCDPPFNERAWGHAELAGDPRWVYGQPPRGESELAWAQHCLAAVRPGGPVVLLMPKAAASRRSGRRIRANLLRAGAVRALYSLREGHDIWCLQRPVPGEAQRTTVWLQEYEPEPGDDPEPVPIIDLLDDEVDLSPARQRLLRERADVGAVFAKTRANVQQASSEIDENLARVLEISAERRKLSTTSLAELVKTGALTVLTPRPGTPDLPVLTSADLAADRSPSGTQDALAEAAVHLYPGDVAASATGMARVVEEEALLGQHLTAYRTSEALDPRFLAGVLRACTPAVHGSSRIDPRRVAVPRLPVEQQRAYAEAFTELDAVHRAASALAESADSLARLGFVGLLDGMLTPGE
ncbi:N-6 DNA methylase [Sciscionella sediminilitoris]|uniref:N-6 DNA methylase n=1 Tax=Sciscionella sediminilitoris TaxID=1445613 RepID=UPI0004DF7F57|nr:N-6 DNA methylase [Sciscionella sp. SE31]